MARDKARTWLELIARGIDPAREDERERREQERRQRLTFASVADDYLAQEVYGPDPKRPLKRTAASMRSAFTDILIPLFGRHPIVELTADDIMPVLERIARVGSNRVLVELGARKVLRRRCRKPGPSPEQARKLFAFTKMLFNWAIDYGGYGLEHSPLDRVKQARRLGTSVRRDRTLHDEELTALLLAVERLPEPSRQAYRVLLHSGLRLKEVGDACWSEIEGEVWTIPAARMKGKNAGTGAAK